MFTPAVHLLLPAAVLLVRAAQRWHEGHDALPRSGAERSDFKGLLKSWQRHFDGVPLDVSGEAAEQKDCLK